MDIDCISSIKRLCLTACLFSSSLKFTCALWPKKYQEPEETGRVHKNPRESVKLLTTIISFVCVKFDERRIWNLTTKINFFFFLLRRDHFFKGKKRKWHIQASCTRPVSDWLLIWEITTSHTSGQHSEQVCSSGSYLPPNTMTGQSVAASCSFSLVIMTA